MNCTAINLNQKLTLLLCLATCGWFTLIYILSSLPAPELMAEIAGLDKLAHLVVYGILGLLISGILDQLNTQKKIPVLLTTLLLVTGTGTFDEIHQLSTPGRTFSLFDLAADFSGAVTAIFLSRIFTSIR